MDLEELDRQPLTLGNFKELMKLHEKKEEEQQQAMLAEFMSGFPDGKPIPHCEFHQSKIDAAKEEREFWQAAKLKLFDKGVSSIGVALRILIYFAVLGLAMKYGVPIPFMENKP